MEPFNYGDNFAIHSKTSKDTSYRFWKEIERLSLEKTRERVKAGARKNKETY